jgi:hypothetical protein
LQLKQLADTSKFGLTETHPLTLVHPFVTFTPRTHFVQTVLAEQYKHPTISFAH